MDVDKVPIYSLLPIQSSLVKHLSSCLIQGGIDPVAVLGKMGYSSTILSDEYNEVPALVLEKMLDALLEETGDSLFGFHLGQRVRPEGFGVLGYIRQACQNLHDFILICIRYEHLISGFGKTRLVQEPGRSVWAWSVQTLNPVFERHATEFMLTALHSTHLLLQRQPCNWLSEVRFAHPGPDCQTQAEEIEAHFGCPVRYNQALSGLVINSDVLLQPFSTADSALLYSLERHAQTIESSHQLNSIYYRAYQILRELVLARQASKENLALTLGISTRQLHRLLAKEQCNYRSLHEQVLLALSVEQLNSNSLSIENIAVNLGYTESQSFIRWFKKQTGKTPSKYRQYLLENS